MDRDLGAGDVARLLDCSISTVRRLVRQGSLTAKRQASPKGRGSLKFSMEDVQDYKDGRPDAGPNQGDSNG